MNVKHVARPSVGSSFAMQREQHAEEEAFLSRRHTRNIYAVCIIIY